jgi:hypothetical protein
MIGLDQTKLRERITDPKNLEEVAQKTQQLIQALKNEGVFSYSPYGEIMNVAFDPHRREIRIISIGEVSFPLAKEAVDSPLIFRFFNEAGKVADIFSIFAIRDRAPNPGFLAIAGGFINMKPPENGRPERFTTIMDTKNNEMKQEIGAVFTPDASYQEAIKNNYDLKFVSGFVTFGIGANAFDVPAISEHIRTYETSNDLLSQGGELIDGAQGRKRVHKTNNVPTLVDITLAEGQKVTAEIVKRYFSPAGCPDEVNDSRGIAVVNFTEAYNQATADKIKSTSMDIINNTKVKDPKSGKINTGCAFKHHPELIGDAIIWAAEQPKISTTRPPQNSLFKSK